MANGRNGMERERETLVRPCLPSFLRLLHLCRHLNSAGRAGWGDRRGRLNFFTLSSFEERISAPRGAAVQSQTGRRRRQRLRGVHLWRGLFGGVISEVMCSPFSHWSARTGQLTITFSRPPNLSKKLNPFSLLCPKRTHFR